MHQAEDSIIFQNDTGQNSSWIVMICVRNIVIIDHAVNGKCPVAINMVKNKIILLWLSVSWSSGYSGLAKFYEWILAMTYCRIDVIFDNSLLNADFIELNADNLK